MDQQWVCELWISQRLLILSFATDCISPGGCYVDCWAQDYRRRKFRYWYLSTRSTWRLRFRRNTRLWLGRSRAAYVLLGSNQPVRRQILVSLDCTRRCLKIQDVWTHQISCVTGRTCFTYLPKFANRVLSTVHLSHRGCIFQRIPHNPRFPMNHWRGYSSTVHCHAFSWLCLIAIPCSLSDIYRFHQSWWNSS